MRRGRGGRAISPRPALGLPRGSVARHAPLRSTVVQVAGQRIHASPRRVSRLVVVEVMLNAIWSPAILDENALAKVVRCDVALADVALPFGDVTCGSLVLHGALLPCGVQVVERA